MCACVHACMYACIRTSAGRVWSFQLAMVLGIYRDHIWNTWVPMQFWRLNIELCMCQECFLVLSSYVSDSRAPSDTRFTSLYIIRPTPHWSSPPWGLDSIQKSPPSQAQDKLASLEFLRASQSPCLCFGFLKVWFLDRKAITILKHKGAFCNLVFYEISILLLGKC